MRGTLGVLMVSVKCAKDAVCLSQLSLFSDKALRESAFQARIANDEHFNMHSRAVPMLSLHICEIHPLNKFHSYVSSH